MVHERKVKETGDVVELRVSGQVRLGNLIMFDAQTGSNWLQETGKSLDGTHQGHSLCDLPPEQWTERVRWDDWQKRHADTKVLICRHCESAAKN